MIGINYPNVQCAPGSSSLFSSTAVFSTYSVISTYRITPAAIAAAGYSCAGGSKANGMSDPARYHQTSVKQSYSLSTRTTL